MNMTTVRWVLVLAAGAFCSHGFVGAAPIKKDALVAHYTFDEGKGATFHDASGNGNDGIIHGATFVKHGDGYALRFDGVDDYVDCGNKPGLNLRKQVTVMAWVLAEARATGESGIVMKGDFTAYGLTLSGGRCWWYISGGENHCMANLGTGTWHRVVGTYDGKVSRLYIDGKPRKSRPLTVPIKSGANLRIGTRGAANSFFKGMIDDVRIYDRALSEQEVSDAFEVEAAAMVLTRPQIKSGPTLKGRGFALRVGARGGIQVEVGGDVYFVESSYSYPGKAIAYNHLSEVNRGGDPLWKPEVRPQGGNAIRVTASGRFYSLERRLELQGHRVKITDTLANTGDGDVGVIVRNLLISGERPAGCLLSGTPGASSDSEENPTVLLSQRSSHLGAVAEDNLSRVQFQAATISNQADFRLGHLGLVPGKSITLEWALYPLAENEDYWTFINRIREDWDTIFRLAGPANMLDVTQDAYWPIFRDKERLAAFLKRSHLKIILLSPWLDYDNMHRQTHKLVGRDEYKQIMRQVKETVKAVDPSIRLVGDIETPWVSLPRPLVEKLYATFPEEMRSKSGFFEFTPAHMRIFQSSPQAWNRWKDSIIWTADGRAKYEYYYRHGVSGIVPMIALTVYPAVGNGQHKYVMEQARFILEDVGLDGVYLDSFTGAKSSMLGYSYDKWDGITVDIDPATGRISRRYTDCALAGTESRKRIVQYALTAGKVVVINGHAIARDTQSLRAFRFDEAEWHMDPLSWADGERPPLVGKLCQAQLSSPIALGFRPHRLGERGIENYARAIVKSAIAHLRHGVLYYFHNTNIPETGPGSGEYGPFNHMFPITPVRLGEGFVEGRERIITCVSRTFDWPRRAAPKILLFDVTGRSKQHTMKPVRTKGGWRVDVALADWQEIAVLEK